MFEICCVGHITLDKVVTPKATVFMPGGTSFYFSSAIANAGVRYALVTASVAQEADGIKTLRSRGVDVRVLPSNRRLFFENIYTENQDHRVQRVLETADPFSANSLDGMAAEIFHLGPLLANDIPLDLIVSLAQRGNVSLDVQGFLRRVENGNVLAVDWPAKNTALQHVHYLKANEQETEVLTGEKDIYEGAKTLADWGVKEVIITLGSRGSVIYHDGVFYNVPAYPPASVEDATGCGDTYMAGYLSQRVRGAGVQQAGEFGAAMATLKIESSGPFTGTNDDVYALLARSRNAVANA